MSRVVQSVPCLHSQSTRHPLGLDALIGEHADAVQRFPTIIADPAAQAVAAAFAARWPAKN